MREGARTRRIWALAVGVGFLLLGLALTLPPRASAAETLAITGIFGSFGEEPGQLSGPIDLTIDAAGNIIVADTGNHRVQKFAPDGTLVWSVGKVAPDPDTGVNRPVSGNGNGEFNRPKDVAVAPDGTILVADADNLRVQRLSANGVFMAKYPFTFDPQGITVDENGNLYMADSSGNKIHKANAAGTLVRSWGTFGTGAGQFNSPFDVSAGGGFVYVSDTFNQRVQKFTTNGDFVQTWGQQAEDPEDPKPGEFLKPNGISATADGSVFVIDTDTARLDEFTADGQFKSRFGDERTLARPGGVFALDDDVAIADTDNSRVVKLLEAVTPPPGTFCDTGAGSCDVGANEVPTVSMTRGEAADAGPVRFVNPKDACERLGFGTHITRQAFFNNKTYEVKKVPEGFMVEIPGEDLLPNGGSLLVSWRCPSAAGASGTATASGIGSGSTVNENWGDATLYDPSGFVRDRTTRKGIRGATVTLQSSPSFSGPFGFADPLSISPRVNPQTTDRRGHYGWDVPDGFYRIRVTAFGYRTLKRSRVVSVPPPVTDLHVRLERDAAEQRRMIEPQGSVGKLHLGMKKAAAKRAAREMSSGLELAFRGGRLDRIELTSGKFRTGPGCAKSKSVCGVTPGIGVGSTERAIRLTYGRNAERKGDAYKLNRTKFKVPKANGATGKVRRVVVE